MSTNPPQRPPGYTPQSVSPYAPPVQGAMPPAFGSTQVNTTGAVTHPVPKASRMAVASLVLGIISLAFFWLWLIFPAICALLAMIFGHVALSVINRSKGWITGKGMAIAGLVMGDIHLPFRFFIVVILPNT